MGYLVPMKILDMCPDVAEGSFYSFSEERGENKFFLSL